MLLNLFASTILLSLATSILACAATHNTPGPVVTKRCDQCGDTIRKHETPTEEVAIRKKIERDTEGMRNGCKTRTIGCDGVPGAADTLLQWNLAQAGTSRDTPASVDRELECNTKGEWTIVIEMQKVVITDVECFSV